jgi:hypothetical protein
MSDTEEWKFTSLPEVWSINFPGWEDLLNEKLEIIKSDIAFLKNKLQRKITR